MYNRQEVASGRWLFKSLISWLPVLELLFAFVFLLHSNLNFCPYCPFLELQTGECVVVQQTGGGNSSGRWLFSRQPPVVHS